MHPVLLEVPAFASWIGASILAAVAAVFVVLALRNREDKGSLWMAALFGCGAFALLAWKGISAPVGPLPVRFFGILVVTGFLAGTRVASSRNRARELMSGDETFDLAFYVLLVGLLGARLMHVAQHTEDFNGKAYKILAIWDGGLVWYGGAVASTLYAWYWLAKNRRPIWAVSDSLALGVVLGQAIGRMGCFMAGCDYGSVVPADAAGGHPWYAVHFPDDPLTLVPREFRTDFETGNPVWLHPVQLYLVAMNLLIFATLLCVDRFDRKRAFPGRIAALYLILYPIGRGILEAWRGDADRGTYDLGFWRASFSQIVSVFVLAGGILLYRWLSRRHHRERPAA